MKFIPYGHQSIDSKDVDAVAEVLKGDWLTTGPKVDEFEKALAKYVGAKYAVAVNSGTSALDIAVGALELEPGSEIITTPFTFVADANCALYNGCIPVFADINPKTYNIIPEQIRKKITKKTKAIIFVDYAGQPCDIDELKKIAKEHNLYLIEDASHAIGAQYKGKKVGSLVDMTIFSFHPVKHLTTGEGGAVTTENEGLYAKLKLLRNHGIDKTPSERAGYAYDMKVLGRNYRITDFQCALGITQLAKLESFIEKRQKIVEKYNLLLSGIQGITVPHVEKNLRHVWHLYTILLDKKINRDEFFASMRKKGIGVNVHYIPIYKFTYYQRFKINPKDFPITEDISSRILTIPLYQDMTNEDVDQVVYAIKETMKEISK
ncbi:MAG: UDP-4-amino-4,6-dideoxy-N-acetyl-beta-L-altrosamine transaminase [Candidatus Micrarchaeota archaeon]